MASLRVQALVFQKQNIQLRVSFCGSNWHFSFPTYRTSNNNKAVVEKLAIHFDHILLTLPPEHSIGWRVPGCGSNIGTQKGTLANGNKDSNLRSPDGLIPSSTNQQNHLAIDLGGCHRSLPTTPARSRAPRMRLYLIPSRSPSLLELFDFFREGVVQVGGGGPLRLAKEP